MGYLSLMLAAFSLTNFVIQAVNERVAKGDPAKGLCRFVNYEGNASRERFEVNPDFWLKGIDFSCASPWNSGGGRTRAGTLISKRHIVFAGHFPLWKGVRILFADDAGGVCPLTIAATREIAGTDIMVGSLDYEVTPNIKPAKILPPDYEEHIGNGCGLPIVTFSQAENASLTELTAIPTNRRMPSLMTRGHSKGSRQREFRNLLVSGDSGNPAFLLVGNETILLYCVKSGGSGGGPALHLYRREIQQAMDELCPGYMLEEFDFSRLTDRK